MSTYVVFFNKTKPLKDKQGSTLRITAEGRLQLLVNDLKPSSLIRYFSVQL